LEIFANDPKVNLDGAITSSATTLTVKNAVNVPTTGTFRARIDDENLAVTAVSGSTWTVTRGDGGTAPASHADGSPIYVLLTREGLDAIVSVQANGTEVSNRRVLNFTGATVTDDATNGRVNVAVPGVSTGSTAARPAASAGGIYLPNDNLTVDLSDRSTWRSYGPIFPIARPPAAANWTTVNYGVGDSLNDTAAGLGMTVARHSSDWFRLAARPLGSPPYTVTAAMLSIYPATNAARSNLCLRDSVSGKQINFGPIYVGFDQQLYVTQMSGPTSFSSHQLQTNFGLLAPMVFLRISDDGTTRSYSIGVDGVTFDVVRTEATGTWLTPDQVAWGVDVPSGGPFASTLIHWNVS
jgi:hypothetical protein